MAITTPLRTETIYRAAQDRIKQYIIVHGLKPGEPIPTETMLARELGISRNSLREALKALAAAGIVETRHGLGTYVRQASLAPLIDGLTFNFVRNLNRDTRTLREMLELREILEFELVRRVTGLHTPEQLTRLESFIVRMEADAGCARMNPEADHAFHDALYEPLGNSAITLILHAFWDVQDAIASQLPAVEPIFAENVRWHRDILEAVRRHDADAAVVAMREQFTGVRRRLNLPDEQRATSNEQ